jgi:nucleoside-diphosphate-sugar epimerase
MKSNVVTVFGAGGYVGSELVPALIRSGYSVRAYDTYWYGVEVFSDLMENPKFSLIIGDVRDLESVKKALQGATQVIHLACISNDPSFDLDPALGRSINLESFKPLITAAKGAGVQRFIYASSSSVYGVKIEERVTEELSLEPLTDYSKFKATCEEIALELQDNDFEVVVARPDTICGYSRRQRFDLAVNVLTNHAVNNRQITVFGGSQYRPNLHIDDMVGAYLHLLKSEYQVNGEILNVGGNNMSLNEIAASVVNIVGTDVQIKHQVTDDLRSYRVDSSKIREKFGFVPKKTVDDAIRELVEQIGRNSFTNPMTNSAYYNIARMQELALG